MAARAPADRTRGPALSEEAAALDPRVDDLDAFARASAARRSRAFATRQSRAGGRRRRCAAPRKSWRRCAARSPRPREGSRQQESAAAGATRADWDRARGERDAGVRPARRSARRRRRKCGANALATVRARALLADATVERVLADASRAARLQSARDELAARRAEAAALESGLAKPRHLRQREPRRAAQLWTRSGLAPRRHRQNGALAAPVRRYWRRVAPSLSRRRAELGALRRRSRGRRRDARAPGCGGGRRRRCRRAISRRRIAPRARGSTNSGDLAGAREGRGRARRGGKDDRQIRPRAWPKPPPRVSARRRMADATARLRLRAEATAGGGGSGARRLGRCAAAALPVARGDGSDRQDRRAHRAVRARRRRSPPPRRGSPACGPRSDGRNSREALTNARKAADERAPPAREAERDATKRRTLETERGAARRRWRACATQLGAADDGRLALALERLERRRDLASGARPPAPTRRGRRRSRRVGSARRATEPRSGVAPPRSPR